MEPAPPTLGEALRYWLKLGCISFGGPAGQIALMHAELVERRRWISERRFLHALNCCMLLPGPEVQQLATYIGWLMHWRLGVQPAVVALVLHAAWRLGGRALNTRVHGALAAGSLGAMLWGVPFPYVLGVAALVGWAHGRFGAAVTASGHAGPTAPVAAAQSWNDDDTPPPPHARWSACGFALVVAVGLTLGLVVYAALVNAAGGQGLPAQMAVFFTKAALLTFRGAYAVLPYVVQGAVEQHGWLTGAQMMAGLALGESTPGPLIMVVAFVGFMGGWQPPFVDAAIGGPWLAGVIGAGVATFFTFLPSFVFIFAGAPLVEATRDDLRFTAPLAAISAAVVGVIAQLGLYFAAHVFWPGRAGLDVPALVIAVAAAVALLRYKRGVLEVLGLSALAGLVWRMGCAVY